MSLILSSLSPLMIASRFLGFNLFSINCKTLKVELNLWNFVLIIKAIICNFIFHLIFWNYMIDAVCDVHSTKVIRSTIPKLVYLSLIGYTTTQIWLFLRRQNAMEMLKLLSEIDEKFLDLKEKFDYQKQKKNLKISLIFFTTLTTTTIVLQGVSFYIYNMGISHPLSFLQLYGFLCSMIIYHHIIIGFIVIQQRFKKLNFFIKAHTLNESSIKKLAEVHFMICKLIKAFNAIYGFVILLAVAAIFGWFCVFIFSIATQSPHFTWKIIFFTIIDFLINTLFLSTFFYLIRRAENAKNEGKITKNLLYEKLHRENNSREIIKDFIYQIDTANVEFSTGLFDLNYNFLFKVRNFCYFSL
jgi:hypothetical protein